MTTSEGDGPVVPMPVPLGRPMRLGPFPSGRAAATFAGFVAMALALAVFVSPLAGLPCLGVGFLLTAYAPDGRPLDEQAARFVRWQHRRRAAGASTRRSRGHEDQGRTAILADGRTVAVLSCGGVPVAFLPPFAAHRLFDAYRTVLRGLDGPLYLRVGADPLSERPFRLSPGAPLAGSEPEAKARAAYDELVESICRRRRRRVVDLMLIEGDRSAAGRARLEARVRAVDDALRGLGVTPQRREGHALGIAISRLGWSLEALE